MPNEGRATAHSAKPSVFPSSTSHLKTLGARPLREPYAGRYGRLLPCRGERIVSRLTPHYRHTSPNRSYGTPLHGLEAKSLLSATRVPLRVPATARRQGTTSRATGCRCVEQKSDRALGQPRRLGGVRLALVGMRDGIDRGRLQRGVPGQPGSDARRTRGAGLHPSRHATVLRRSGAESSTLAASTHLQRRLENYPLARGAFAGTKGT
jgi:hypothetical protein